MVVVSVGVGGTTGYASGGGWLPPAPFDLQGGGGVNIAMVPAGGAIGVWGQYGEARTSTYSAADRWSPIAYLADEFFEAGILLLDSIYWHFCSILRRNGIFIVPFALDVL